MTNHGILRNQKNDNFLAVAIGLTHIRMMEYGRMKIVMIIVCMV